MPHNHFTANPAECRRAHGPAPQSQREGEMYQPPKLEYYGTFRELTLVGTTGADDGVPVGQNVGLNLCKNLNPPFPPGVCTSF
jgi:hypothetical protein